MPSLIQTGETFGVVYPLVQGDSSIVALGNAAGGSSDLLLETGDYLLLEDGFKLILD